MRYWVYPFEDWQEFGEKRKEEKEKGKNKRGERKEFGITSN